MATNIKLVTEPVLWNSAYDDIEFVFEFKQYNISTAVSTSPYGYAQINTSINFDITPQAGEYVYISTGIYAGTHKVISATSSSVTIDFAYAGNQTTGYVEHLRVPTFSFYKGFRNTETFPAQLPYTLVNTFVPQRNGNRQISINLFGLINNIFEVVPPSITSDYAYDIFNAFRLTYDTEITPIKYVLNSTIDTTTLNQYYVNTGAYLCPEKPVKWSCGVSFMVRFKGGFPLLELYQDGEQVQQGFSTAFSLAFNNGLYLE